MLTLKSIPEGCSWGMSALKETFICGLVSREWPRPESLLLLPHWRFVQGFDLKAYFETATRTDFVMIVTGLGAVPFLKDGPVADAESFAEANKVFGEQWLGYAFWFN